MPVALTSRLVGQMALQHWVKLNGQMVCRLASTSLQPMGDAAVKWNPQVDRTQPDYTTPMDKKTLEAKIDFYYKMKDPKEDLSKVVQFPLDQLTPDMPKADQSVWDLWGTLHYPPDKIGRFPEDWKEYPERDTKNYPHKEFKDYGPRVRMGFVPDSWFQFFYDKTGVTGPYCLGVGMVMFLMQKEMLVWEHSFKRFYVYLILIPWIWGLTNKIVLSYIDKIHINKINIERNAVKTTVSDLRDVVFQQQFLIDFYKAANTEISRAKHENVDMQLEAEYRERLKTVHSEVKKRMDFLIEVDSARRRFEHKHMVEWIVNEVRKSVTPQLEKAIMDQCFVDLKRLTQDL